jgi:gluconate 2-dehydrogenase gamma chain
MGEAARTRREFLSRAGGALGAGFVAAHWPSIAAAHAHALSAAADRTPAALGFFTAGDAHDVEAISAQIIPTDATPGAREAGAVYFIDRSLLTWHAPRAAEFRSGLADFREKFAAAHPGGAFATADEPTQLAFLTSQEKSAFFSHVRALTLIGMFALPQYGGNRDGIGWQLIGFEDRHVFAPPFGDYDRDYPGFKLPDRKT